MERGISMWLHASVIGIIAFVVLRFALGQTPAQSEDKSLLISSVVLIYMLLFGHGLPKHINKNIY